MAVGIIRGVHRLPNWHTAAPALARHMGSLFEGIRPGLKRVQRAHPDDATAQHGLLFFEVPQVPSPTNCVMYGYVQPTLSMLQ